MAGRRNSKQQSTQEVEILVAAAAGSGTAYWWSELFPDYEGEHPLDIDRLLVGDLSKAAASEMSQRIGEAIQKTRNESLE